MMLSLSKTNWRYIFIYLLIIPCFALLLIELGLRIFTQAPHGYFFGFHAGSKGLYPENQDTVMLWGPFAYRLQTNSYGMRSPEFTMPKPDNTFRIITIGDSITDGFFVDNSDTWQYQLQSLLQSNTKATIEILNASHGGGGIDKEYAILKDIALDLEPDMIILTFVTNDIYDIYDKTREQLFSYKLIGKTRTHKLHDFALQKTALGETLFLYYLKTNDHDYHHPDIEDLNKGDDRYFVEHGSDFKNNSKLFHQSYFKTDGLVLNPQPYPKAQNRIDNHCFMLDQFISLATQHGIKVLVNYFPAYTEIYGSGTGEWFPPLLQQQTINSGAQFLNLNTAMRTLAPEKVKHLAPKDFHLNPYGHKVMALGISNYLQTDQAKDFFQWQ